jgi:hypothetical protein
MRFFSFIITLLNQIIGDSNEVFLFHLYTDESVHQLEAVTMQDYNPIVFYSRKLNTAQKRLKPLRETESCY